MTLIQLRKLYSFNGKKQIISIYKSKTNDWIIYVYRNQLSSTELVEFKMANIEFKSRLMFNVKFVQYVYPSLRYSNHLIRVQNQIYCSFLLNKIVLQNNRLVNCSLAICVQLIYINYQFDPLKIN